MRILPAGFALTSALTLALILAPGLAAAQQCPCTCVRGRSVPACPPTTLVQPICQQICTDKVEQSLSGPSLSGGGSGGGASSAAASAASSAGISGAAAAAAMGR